MQSRGNSHCRTSWKAGGHSHCPQWKDIDTRASQPRRNARAHAHRAAGRLAKTFPTAAKSGDVARTTQHGMALHGRAIFKDGHEEREQGR